MSALSVVANLAKVSAATARCRPAAMAASMGAKCRAFRAQAIATPSVIATPAGFGAGGHLVTAATNIAAQPVEFVRSGSVRGGGGGGANPLLQAQLNNILNNQG